MPNSNKEQETQQIHTLLSRPIEPLCSWGKFLERWQAATSLEEMLGLLHSGFDVPITPRRDEYCPDEKIDNTDKVLFYLAIADGWADNDLLRLPDDGEKCFVMGYHKNCNPQRKDLSMVRQIVAKKAFDILCSKYLSMELRDRYWNGSIRFVKLWSQEVTSVRLFPEIQNFFRMYERYSHLCIRNIPIYDDVQPSHNEEQAQTFLLNLAEFVWGWEEYSGNFFNEKEREASQRANKEMQNRLDAAKSWLVEILTRIDGGFGFLEKHLLNLDEACINKLTEISFRYKLGSNDRINGQTLVLESRPVETIEEAFLVGSQTAQLLISRNLKIKEIQHLVEIRDAEKAKQDAERNLEKLRNP